MSGTLLVGFFFPETFPFFPGDTMTDHTIRTATLLATFDIEGLTRQDRRETPLGNLRASIAHLPHTAQYCVLVWDTGRPSIVSARPFQADTHTKAVPSVEPVAVSLENVATSGQAWQRAGDTLATSLCAGSRRFDSSDMGCFVDGSDRSILDTTIRIIALGLEQGVLFSDDLRPLSYYSPDDSQGIRDFVRRYGEEYGVGDSICTPVDQVAEWLTEHRCDPSVEFSWNAYQMAFVLQTVEPE